MLPTVKAKNFKFPMKRQVIFCIFNMFCVVSSNLYSMFQTLDTYQNRLGLVQLCPLFTASTDDKALNMNIKGDEIQEIFMCNL